MEAARIYPDDGGRTGISSGWRAGNRPERQSENAPFYLDEIDPNYKRFHQRLREVLEDGHDVVRWELQAPRSGFRFVRAYVKDGPPLTWNHPWEGECI